MVNGPWRIHKICFGVFSPHHLGQASDGDNLKDSAAQLMATRISELEVKSVFGPMELAFWWETVGKSGTSDFYFMESK